MTDTAAALARTHGKTAQLGAHDTGEVPRPGYSWYVIGVLILANIMSSVDRQLLALLVAPIRHDLAISDTQISLLQGLSFALFYAVMGLPFGWLADRTNRRNLIIVGVFFWSLMTLACGLASSFGELFSARVGVGIGEAALLPAAYSMIADYFPPARCGRALGAFTIAQFAGVGVSWGVGGAIIHSLDSGVSVSLPLVGQLASWKLSFAVVGSAGFVLCPLLLTVREPVRRGLRVAAATGAASGASLWSYFRRHRAAFIPVYLVYGLMAFVGYNFQAWLPTYFERRYHVPAAAAGIQMGLIISVAGMLGCILGGLLGDLWTAQGRIGGKFRLTALWWALALASSIAIFVASSASTCLLYVGLQNIGAAIALSSAAASIQDIVPNELRGRSTAVYLLMIGIVGFGMGPSAVALVTDHVFHNDAALRYSLLVVPVPAILCGAALTWIGLEPYRRVYDSLRGRAVPAGG